MCNISQGIAEKNLYIGFELGANQERENSIRKLIFRLSRDFDESYIVQAIMDDYELDQQTAEQKVAVCLKKQSGN